MSRQLLWMVVFTALVQTTGAQPLQRYQGPFQLGEVIQGQVDHQFKRVDGDSIIHGRFNFNALDNQRCNDYDARKVSIQGQFSQGKLDGSWTIEDEKYKIAVDDIDRLRAQTALFGTHSWKNISFDNGKPHGKWVIQFNDIQNSRVRGGRMRTEASFKQGYIVGDFKYTSTGNRPINVTGRFDELGRFDGRWQLNYLVNELPFEEVRVYHRGYLLSLTLTSNGRKVYEVEYQDVRTQLEAIEEGNSQQFSKGQRGFGILFDNGYQADDLRIKSQEPGNEVIGYVLEQYTGRNRLHKALADVDTPMIAGTRRFKFVYPDYEEEILTSLRTLSQKLVTQFDSVLQDQRFILNLQNYDSLAFYYGFVEAAQQRLQAINGVVALMDEGRFDYENRNNYYANGVVGLTRTDTVRYGYGNRSRTQIIDYFRAVNNADSLVHHLHQMLLLIKQRNDEFSSYISGLFNSIRQEQTIEELDSRIITYLDSVNVRFTGNSRVEPNVTDEQLRARHAFSESQLRFYRRVVLEHARLMVNEYAKTPERDKKIEKGRELLALYRIVHDVHPLLADIDRMKIRLDSAYTRYTENPFLDRKAETRVKTHIYNKGALVLLPKMIDDLMLVKSAADIDKQIFEIYQLYHRMNELAYRDDDEVIRLNARLRRENVPERIKRMLEL